MSGTLKPSVAITGIHLCKQSGNAVVLVEIGGEWVEVVRENAALSFSHIVEPEGIVKEAKKRGIEFATNYHED